MKALVVDNDLKQADIIEQIILEVVDDITVLKHSCPVEALIDIIDQKPEVVFIDRVMTPERKFDGPQLKALIDAIDDYQPFGVLFSGASQFDENFDHVFEKPVMVKDIEISFAKYKNRDRDFLREFLEELFKNKNDVDFLYNLVSVKITEKPKKQKQLLQRLFEVFDYNIMTSKRRLFKIVSENSDIFEVEQRYPPDKFIKRLIQEYALYLGDHCHI